MRLFERVILDVISRYVHAVDTDALRLDLRHQRATLSNVDLAPPGHVPPTVLFMGVPFTVSAPSRLDSLNIEFSGGKIGAHASGLVLHLRHIRFERSADNAGVNDALARAKRTQLAEAERHATGLFGTLLEKLFPLLLQKLQASVSNIHILVHLSGGHTLELSMAGLSTGSGRDVADKSPMLNETAVRLRTRSASHGDLDVLSTGAGSRKLDSMASAHNLLGYSSRYLGEGVDRGQSPSPPPIASGTHVAGYAKSFVLSGVNVRLDGEDVFSLVEIVLCLRLELGEFFVDVWAKDPISLIIGDALTQELVALRRDSGMWEFAAKYRRPRHSACEGPNAWWRYAVRVVMRSSGCGHIEADQGRSRLVRCVEYHRLHLERLNRGTRTPDSTLERCRRLEDVLDVETVLLLRSRARNAVRAEKAAQFAAEDWLGWMLVGDTGDVSGRKITTDIREAMNSFEEARDPYASLDGVLAGVGLPVDNTGSAVSAVASGQMTWTRAVVSARFDTMNIVVMSCEDGLEVIASLSGVHFRAEVDSPFSSLVVDAGIGNFTLSDGQVQYVRLVRRLPEYSADVRRGNFSVATNEFNSLHGEAAHIVELPDVSGDYIPEDLDGIVSVVLNCGRDGGLNWKGTAAVRLGVLEVHVDVARLSPVIGLFSKLARARRGLDSSCVHDPSLPLLNCLNGASLLRRPFAYGDQAKGEQPAQSRASTRNRGDFGGSLGSRCELSMYDLKSSSSFDWSRGLVVTLHGNGIRLVLSSGLAVLDDECLQRRGVMLDMSKIEFECGLVPGGEIPAPLGTVSFSLRSCTVANDIVLEGSSAEEDAADAELTDDEGFIRVVSVADPILLDFRVHVSVRDEGVMRFCLDGEDVHVSTDEIQAVTSLVANLVEEISLEWDPGDTCASVVSLSDNFRTTPFTHSAWVRTTRPTVSSRVEESRPLAPMGSPGILFEEASTSGGLMRTIVRVQVLVPSLRLMAFDELGASEPIAALAIRGLDASWQLGHSRRMLLTTKELIVSDPTRNGELYFGVFAGEAAAVSMQMSYAALSEEPREEFEGGSEHFGQVFSVECGIVEACARAEFIRRVAVFVANVGRHFKQAMSDISSQRIYNSWGNASTSAVYGLGACSSGAPSPREFGQLKCSIQSANVKWNIDPCHASLVGKRLFLETSAGSWGGSLASLEVVNADDNSLHSSFVASQADSTSNRNQKRLIFRVTSSAIDFELCSIRVVVAREFIEALFQSTQIVAVCLQDAGRDIFSSPKPSLPLQEVVHDMDTNRTARRITLVGSNMFVVLPGSVDEAFEAGLDIHELRVCIGTSSSSLSMQKISLLTSPCSIPQRALGVEGGRSRDWHVLLGPTDVEVERIISSSSFPEERNHGSTVDDISAETKAVGPPKFPVRRQKDEWRIRFARAIMVFISKRQIEGLRRLAVYNFWRSELEVERDFKVDLDLEAESPHGSAKAPNIETGSSLPSVRRASGEPMSAPCSEAGYEEDPEGTRLVCSGSGEPQGSDVTLYNRSVVNLDLPGGTLELVPGEEEGRTSESICKIEAGAMGFTSEIFSVSQGKVLCLSPDPDPNASNPNVSVTRIVVDVAWLHVWDMRPVVPPVHSLVANAEPNGEAADGSQWTPVSFLHIQVHSKKSSSGQDTSKIDVRLLSPQVVWRPELADQLSALLSIFDRPAGEDDKLSLEPSSSSSASTGSDGRDAVQDTQMAPTLKLSVLIESPQAFVVEAPLCELSRGVEIAADRVKFSCLLDNQGKVVTGPHVRARGIEISSCAACDFSGQARSGMETGGAYPLGFNFPPEFSTGDLFPVAQRRNDRRSIAASTEAPESILRCWAFDIDAPVVLFRIKTLRLRLPSPRSPKAELYVPHVILDGTVCDVAALAIVIPRLHVVSMDKHHSVSGAIADIHGVVRDFECIVRVPQHRARAFEGRGKYIPNPGRLGCGGDGSSLIRAKIAAELQCSENLRRVDVDVKGKGVRAFDGQTGVWDRRDVLEPFAMHLCGSSRPSTWIRISLVDSVQFNLSPLIVKVLAHSMYAMRASIAHLRSTTASSSIPRTSTPSAAHREDSDTCTAYAPSIDPAAPSSSVLSVGCSFSSLQVRLLSETMRIRATIAECDLQVEVPLRDGFSGQFAIRVGDVSVVNETPRRKTEENGRDWSVLLSPFPGLVNSGRRRRFVSLIDRVENFFNIVQQRGSRQAQLEHGLYDMEERELYDPHPVEVPSSSSPIPREPAPYDLISRSGGSHARSSLVEQKASVVFAAVVQLGNTAVHDGEMRFGLSGIDVCLDADVYLDLVDWVSMLASTLAGARELHAGPASPPEAVASTNEDQLEGVNGTHRALISHVTMQAPWRSCRVVVESLGVQFSARAPSSSISSRSLSLWRVAEGLLGSEYVSNIVLTVPKVDRVVRFHAPADIYSALGVEYRASAISHVISVQILRQIPSFISLARVGILSLMRHGNGPKAQSHNPDRQHVEGLLEISDESNAEWERRHCIRERVSLLDSESTLLGKVPSRRTVSASDGDGVGFGSRQLLPAGVLDIAGGAGQVSGRIDDASGFMLYELLRQRDSHLRESGGRYQFFVQVMNETALLVTDSLVLVIGLPNHDILEPRLSVTEIAGYRVPRRGQPRIVVDFVNPGRTEALTRMGRDTVSMVEAMQTRPALTVLCGQREMAESLAAMLPTATQAKHELPNVILEDC